MALEDLGLEFLNNKDQERLRIDYLNSNKNDSDEDEEIETSEEIKDDTTKEDIETSSSTDETISSPYVPFAKHLAEEGVILDDDLENFDGTLESLVTKIKDTIDHYRKSDIEQLPENARSFIEMVKSGVPIDKAQSIVKEQISINDIKVEDIEEDEDIQKNIVRQYLKRLGNEDEDIEEQIEYLSTIDKLEQKATVFHSKLKEDLKREEQVEKDKAVAAEQFRKQEIAKQLEMVKKSIETMEEVVPGVKMSKKDKETVFKNLTTPYALDENKQPITFVQSVRNEDPVKFEIILNYLASKGVFKGDFSSLINISKSKVVEDLDKALEKHSFQGSKGSSTVNKRNQDRDKEAEDTKELANSIPGSLQDLLNYQKQK